MDSQIKKQEEKDNVVTEELESSQELESSEETESKEDTKAFDNLKKEKKQRKPVTTKRLVVSFLIKLFVIAAAIWIVFAFVLGVTINHGNSMHPAVNDGDLVIVLRLQRPYLNAVVLYRQDGKTRTGRVVGLSGNVIDFSENGELLIDGSIASEDVFYPTHRAEDSEIQFPYKVEEGRAFILNDYREDTNDSRSFGTVSLDDIDGPVILTIRRRGF